MSSGFLGGSDVGASLSSFIFSKSHAVFGRAVCVRVPVCNAYDWPKQSEFSHWVSLPPQGSSSGTSLGSLGQMFVPS